MLKSFTFKYGLESNIQSYKRDRNKKEIRKDTKGKRNTSFLFTINPKDTISTIGDCMRLFIVFSCMSF